MGYYLVRTMMMEYKVSTFKRRAESNEGFQDEKEAAREKEIREYLKNHCKL